MTIRKVGCMLIQKEFIEDALQDSEWFINEKRRRMDTTNSIVSIKDFTIDRIWDVSEKTFAIQKVAENLMLELDGLGENWNIYLMINKLVLNPKSKVENYLKLWKSVKREYDFGDKTLFGQETKMVHYDSEYFSGFVKMPVKNLPLAMKIVAKNPERNIIIISCNDKYLLENETKKIFIEAFKYNSVKVIQADYYKLSLELPRKGDMLIRWLDFGDMMEIGLVY